MSTYTTNGNTDSLQDLTLNQGERYIYGSSRLGMYTFGASVDHNNTGPNTTQYYSGGSIYRGYRQYELSNHLGNVLATLSDRKIGVSSGGSLIDYYEPDILSANDYYPFGMLSRVALSNNGVHYKFGFNGKEHDWEAKGWQNQQDYGMRIYDPRIGRFLSVDPLQKQYPELTPYQFSSNTPIQAIDLDGLEHEWYLYQWHPKSGLTFIKKITQTRENDWNDLVPSVFKGIFERGNHALRNIMNASADFEGKLINHKSKTIIVEYYNDQEAFKFEKSFSWHKEVFESNHAQIYSDNTQPRAVDGRMLAMVTEQGWQESLYYSVRADVSFSQAANYAADETGITYNPNSFGSFSTASITNKQSASVNNGNYQGAQTNSVSNSSNGQKTILYHYTDAKGVSGILSTKTLRPSLKATNPSDARYGDGQYLSDIVPVVKALDNYPRLLLIILIKAENFPIL